MNTINPSDVINEPDHPDNEKSNFSGEKHVIAIVVSNKPGALVRIALIFTRRGYNIDNLSTHPLPNKKYSLMTLCASGEKKVLTQILKQVNKLVDVLKAVDIAQDRALLRELAMFKLGFTKDTRGELLSLIETLSCTIEQASPKTITLSCVSNSQQLDSLEALFSEYDLIDCVRTGTILLSKDDIALPEYDETKEQQNINSDTN